MSWEIVLGTPKITTRFLSVRVGGRSQVLFETGWPLIRVEVRSGNETCSMPVSSTYGYQEGTGEAAMRASAADPTIAEPNTIALMLTGKAPNIGIVSVHLFDASSGVELKRVENVEGRLPSEVRAESEELDRKIARIFAGKVVRKELVRKIKCGSTVPVYVLEYLAGKYCATDDPVAVEAGLKIVNATLTENFVRPDEANKVQSLVKEKGRYILIDKVKVRYLAEDDKYWAEIVNFGHKFIHVPDRFVRQYDRLLVDGVWCEIELRHEYDDQASGKRSPFWIDDLKPIQVASFNFTEYETCRRQFSSDEWVDLLIRTIGLEPTGMSKRLKLLFLTRLVPLAEQNYNLVELGPRETGRALVTNSYHHTRFC